MAVETPFHKIIGGQKVTFEYLPDETWHIFLDAELRYEAYEEFESLKNNSPHHVDHLLNHCGIELYRDHPNIYVLKIDYFGEDCKIEIHLKNDIDRLSQRIELLETRERQNRFENERFVRQQISKLSKDLQNINQNVANKNLVERDLAELTQKIDKNTNCITQVYKLIKKIEEIQMAKKLLVEQDAYLIQDVVELNRKLEKDMTKLNRKLETIYEFTAGALGFICIAFAVWVILKLS